MEYRLGVDIGSTTVKAVLLRPEDGEILYSSYLRHGARQSELCQKMLAEVLARFGDRPIKVALSGSGGKDIANAIGAFYVQEVVANSVAIQALYPRTRVAIELGGQDAKIIFFHSDEKTKALMATDMRMNGSCAGGTGAFIDEMANLLKVPPEGFEALAAGGSRVYDISGRCGVFAKTDIQPLLNQGVSREDLALSALHAIARQTIGGLAQGLEISPPVVFEGGPLTFNPTLVRVFAERLGLSGEDIVVPDKPELVVAQGAALAIDKLFGGEASRFKGGACLEILAGYREERLKREDPDGARPFFESEEERRAYQASRALSAFQRPRHEPGTRLPVYLGLDAGSTTSKFVLLGEDGRIEDSFYAKNDGKPLEVIKEALIAMRDRYAAEGVALDMLGVGTTGYGELLFAKAFGADYHTVETVAHAEAALRFAPGASFILDIGGQDMKAISISQDIVTGIVLNEACSAGCGSFLENFSQSMGIKVEDIADLAFSSKSPSRLGSRCTVFMNSSIITEQRNGKRPEDIVAGLCRSVIENVFTKVVRLSNIDALGDKIVVQGGTFRNDAVLRALEQYTGKEAVRAPYPGEMGAIGIALLTKRHMEGLSSARRSSFIGLEALEAFSSSSSSGHVCAFCSNRCNRTLVAFSNGSSYITGNRCERGEILGDLGDASVRERVRELSAKMDEVPDLIRSRERLLFKDYEPRRLSKEKRISIGIPLALEFWNSLPFWKAFYESLGFELVPSSKSTRALFEKGLHAIPSDTVCYPAKLAHGHIMDLVDKQVDRIFMPIMNRMPPENPGVRSDYVCAVVKGYPIVLSISHDEGKRHGIPFDTPLFNWFDEDSRDKQIAKFMGATYGLPYDIVALAIAEGDRAMALFNEALQAEGASVLKGLRDSGGFGVVLACRPYHSDGLVNHGISRCFTKLGIPVLTIDSLPGINEKDMSMVRAEATINFHVRMMAAAMAVGENPDLELVQLVSFGCGHDAILTDEVTRILRTASRKDPLVLKMDESSVAAPLNIRVKSFVETIRARRAKQAQGGSTEIGDPFPLKFLRGDRKLKTILVPNVSRAFAEISSASLRKEGFRVEILPMAGPEAIRLGKKYVHNDICFPAQVNIGEALYGLVNGVYDPDRVVIGLGKSQCDCRLAHYSALARKALDEAGFPQVPMITTDGTDLKNLHPGFSLGPLFYLRMLWGFAMIDGLENLRRRTRPYESVKGMTDLVFERSVSRVASSLERSIPRALRSLRLAVDEFNAIAVEPIPKKPKVFIIGEFLMNFHPGANNNIEEYLESNGMEVILPDILNAFRKDYLRSRDEMRHFHMKHSLGELIMVNIANASFGLAFDTVRAIMSKARAYEPKEDLRKLTLYADGIIDTAFTAGEGWMIAAEILHQAAEGVNSFIIIQPFGCMPNHVTGRGIVKAIKERYPQIQVVSLDYDPDTSVANIENRLQMLIINAKEMQKDSETAAGSVAAAASGGPA
jgi:predicted CoA-substrate-specific enzyme activase